MANSKRHGGHILPEEVAFPPAHPSAPATYVHPDHYTPINPYYQAGSATPPPTHPPTAPVPVPPRDRRNARHGGTMSPEDVYPEKSSAPADAISTTSTKLTKASGGSPTNKRHGGSKSPEEDYGQNVRSPPTHQPPPHPPRFASYHSPSPSYTTDKHGDTKEYVEERIYPVTNNSSTQAMQHSYVPQPQLPETGKRKMHQIGYRNIWNPTSTFRWLKAVHFHKRANLKYGQTLYRHRDAAGRVYQGVDEERFILNQDVHLARMLVQAADDIYKGDSSATWRRTFIRNKAPLMIRLANWPTNAVPSHRKHWTNQDWTRVALIWPVACLGLCIAFLQLGPTYSYYPANMKYPALVYKYWGYPKVSRNALESPAAQSAEGTSTDATHPVAERPLNPRCLWIQDPSSKSWEKVVVEHWLSPHNESLLLPFILVAYTANQFDHDSQSDINALHRVARQAAADAGVEAYWCADSCMSTDADEMEQDVWRISDVIRAAHSLTIALKQPNTDSRAYSDDMLLKDWGSRMWTLPEALLGPKDNPVRMYRSNAGSVSLVCTADRRQLPPMLWADAPLTRQLVDHYEGNITLSRLELVILALKALSARSTSPYLKGDLAYILMGLLRRRPHVDATDSQFQAFARLSLANDSDRLLERLFCVQPVTPDQPWYWTDDAYKVNLWDIEPTCQIAAICDNDTVVIDGCFAAAIRWETFYAPWHRRNASWRRLAADLTIRGFTILFMIAFWILIMGAAQKASSSSSSLKKRQYNFDFSSSSSTTTSSPQSLVVTGGILLGLSLPIWILSPWLTRILFGGKAWDVAPYFFGFEGHLDIETIESMIYGFPSGRLKWSVAGSNLSRHRKNEFGECMGDDPTNDPAVMKKVERAKTASFGDMRVFTLVDTRHGLVTMFEAVRPPSATLLCAQEGGMTRAVMVSLDWKTSTLYRETVLRMPTPMIQDCWRVDRVRVGLKRPVEDVVPCLEV